MNKNKTDKKLEIALHTFLIMPVLIALFFQVFEISNLRIALFYWIFPIIWIIISLVNNSLDQKAKNENDHLVNVYLNLIFAFLIISMIHLSMLGWEKYEKFLNNISILGLIINSLFFISFLIMAIFSGLLLVLLILLRLKRKAPNSA